MDELEMKKSLSSQPVQQLIRQVIGKTCCRKQVGYRNSMNIGLGCKVFHQNPKLRDKFYGEWEIGTYNSAWRVVHAGKIICASHDPVTSVEELDATFNRVKLTSLLSIEQLTDFDVRLIFDHGLSIDFMTTISDEDEAFHIFCPKSKYVEFTVGHGWTAGESNTAWQQ